MDDVATVDDLNILFSLLLLFFFRWRLAICERVCVCCAVLYMQFRFTVVSVELAKVIRKISHDFRWLCTVYILIGRRPALGRPQSFEQQQPLFYGYWQRFRRVQTPLGRPIEEPKYKMREKSCFFFLFIRFCASKMCEVISLKRRLRTLKYHQRCTSIIAHNRNPSIPARNYSVEIQFGALLCQRTRRHAPVKLNYNQIVPLNFTS